jgi:hypothetical protein
MKGIATAAPSPFIEAVRLPGVSPEADGDGLTKAVQLQPTRTHCIHHTRIVDDVHWDASLMGTDLQVCMRWAGGAKGCL